MIWFVATIILQCEVAGQPSQPEEWTCIQQVHVIRAADREQAYEKAVALARAQEHSYLNADGQEVFWKYLGLEDLDELLSKTIRDGTEIWGRIFHTDEPQDFIRNKDHLTSFYIDEIRHLTAAEIIKDGFESRLVYKWIDY